VIKFFSYGKALPDFEWIKDHAPILEVAEVLGLTLKGKKTTCPHCHKKDRLTFSVRLKVWRCWECGAKGSVIDLVMFYTKEVLGKDISNLKAAKWICERWNMVGRVQPEFSENQRGITKHKYMRFRPIPISEGKKPSLGAMVSSPNWAGLSPATGKVILTLWGLLDEEGKATMSREQLKNRTGIRDSHVLARVNKEIYAMGLFQIDRGHKTEYTQQSTVYVLSWYSLKFQAWLNGSSVPATPAIGGTLPAPSVPEACGLDIIPNTLLHPSTSKVCVEAH
jgi:ribosomal protein L37AE/L43A